MLDDAPPARGLLGGRSRAKPNRRAGERSLPSPSLLTDRRARRYGLMPIGWSDASKQLRQGVALARDWSDNKRPGLHGEFHLGSFRNTDFRRVSAGNTQRQTITPTLNCSFHGSTK